jgi:hypothetical protein
MYVYCNGFWNGFKEFSDGINFSFFKHILENVFGTEIQLSGNSETSDILLESHFGNSLLFSKNWKYSLFFSGEGLHGLPKNYENYTIIFGGIDSGKNFIACPLYYLYEYCRPYTYKKNINKIPEKDILAVISANHTNSFRNKFIDELQQRGFSVDFGGSYKNNIGGQISGNWHTSEIQEVQNKYKLVLALENSKQDYYITEKIINPLRAGTIPVYYGSENIDKLINKKRIVIIDENNLDQTFSEISRLISDKEYWLQKVNSDIFLTPLEIILQKIINKMKQILSYKKFNTEVICNMYTESERLSSLEGILKHFSIKPTFTVWGKNVKQHKYFSKFKNTTTTPAISLAINTVCCFEDYKNTDKPLLICESDCIPLYSLEHIETKINDIIRIMQENDIDFVFLNKGHLQHVDTNNFTIYFSNERINMNVDFKNIKCYENILYNTNVSRCTEAFLVSPKGIRAYLEYFHSRNDHVPIDWNLNYFFYDNKNIKSCWLIPELFKQYGYTSSIPHSIL